MITWVKPRLGDTTTDTSWANPQPTCAPGLTFLDKHTYRFWAPAETATADQVSQSFQQSGWDVKAVQIDDPLPGWRASTLPVVATSASQAQNIAFIEATFHAPAGYSPAPTNLCGYEVGAATQASASGGGLVLGLAVAAGIALLVFAK